MTCCSHLNTASLAMKNDQRTYTRCRKIILKKKNCRLLKVPGTHFLRCHNFFQPQFQMGAISVGPINARLPPPLSCFLLPANLVINCWLPRRSLDASIYIKSKQTINLLEVRRRLYVLFMHIRSVRAYQ